MTHRCHVTNCHAEPTHTVQRLWAVKGKALPLTYCCDAHKPGAAVPNAQHTATFYRVEPLVARAS